MAPLTADAKRLRTIIISFPLLVVTSAILYRRAYLGEEQRTIPHTSSHDHVKTGQERILGRGVGEIGAAPWIKREVEPRIGGVQNDAKPS